MLQYYAPLAFAEPRPCRGHLRGGRVLEMDEKAVQRGIGPEPGDEFEKLEIVAVAAPATAEPEELVERAAVRLLEDEAGCVRIFRRVRFRCLEQTELLGHVACLVPGWSPVYAKKSF